MRRIGLKLALLGHAGRRQPWQLSGAKRTRNIEWARAAVIRGIRGVGLGQSVNR